MNKKRTWCSVIVGLMACLVIYFPAKKGLEDELKTFCSVQANPERCFNTHSNDVNFGLITVFTISFLITRVSIGLFLASDD